MLRRIRGNRGMRDLRHGDLGESGGAGEWVHTGCNQPCIQPRKHLQSDPWKGVSAAAIMQTMQSRRPQSKCGVLVMHGEAGPVTHPNSGIGVFGLREVLVESVFCPRSVHFASLPWGGDGFTTRFAKLSTWSGHGRGPSRRGKHSFFQGRPPVRVWGWGAQAGGGR